MRLLSPPAIPVVNALPPAGTAGRMLVLDADKHVYVDGGASWVSATGGDNMPLVRAGTNGYWVAGAVNASALTTSTLTASRIYFIPFSVPRQIALTRLGLRVTTAAAGTGDLGIYANSAGASTDVPGLLLTQLSSTLNMGTTGTKFGAVSITLSPNTIYWAALVSSSAAGVQCLAVGGVGCAMGFTPDATSARTHVYQAGSGSTLPYTAGSVAYGTGVCPIVYLMP